MSDRTVHASYRGMEVVRYDRAGKWYLEPRDRTLKRQHVTLSEAVNAAIWGRKYGNGTFFLGLCGGTAFDAKVKARVVA
jgi:hypothetical protein